MSNKDSSLTDLVGNEIGLKVKVEGGYGGGCINEGVGMTTEKGEKIFVKMNSKSEARIMFDGEYSSLEALHGMDMIKVPKPIKVFDMPSGGAALIMEYIDFHGLSKYSAKLGEQLARLHLLNAELEGKAKKSESFVGKSDLYKYVDKFGFYSTTCCGYLQQDNTWKDTWVYNNREAREMWSALLPNLPKLFDGVDIKPALLHGDLWGGNVGETKSEPVIFDPASFYGHSEYDLAISKMFGGFDSSFFDSYFRVIPHAAGYRKRSDLYKLFHYLNHWNHFGGGYQGSSLSTLKKVLQYVT